MDPYGDHNREKMSPLDKSKNEKIEVVTATPEKKVEGSKRNPISRKK